MKECKVKKFDELSKDITDKELEIEFDEIKNSGFEIESIIDIFNDPKKIKEGYTGIPSDLTNKELNRGDIIYITAMVRKTGHSVSSPACQAVIKLRIVDIYRGLSYLNKVINK
jgi:hypothetical protein